MFLELVNMGGELRTGGDDSVFEGLIFAHFFS
jgi:hypothetical protein